MVNPTSRLVDFAVATFGSRQQPLLLVLLFLCHCCIQPCSCWPLRFLWGLEDLAVKDHGPTFDHAMAMYLLNISRVTYCDIDQITDWSCKPCGEPSLSPLTPIFVNRETPRHVGVYVAYDSDRNLVVTAFRGTLFLINWIQDLEYYKIDSAYKQCDMQSKSTGVKKRCMVHAGFHDDWLSVKADVVHATKAVLAQHPNATVAVTGHSLGGALAAFCALDLSIILNRTDIIAYTFGQPRIGNVAFSNFWASRVPGGVRMVHADDVVPHLPPRGKTLLLLTDFHHTMTEVWQTGPNDDELRVCVAGAGEDPLCSNSLAQWDRSVEAHLTYLGMLMKCD